MLIRDMRREAADALLTRARMGHIACTEGQQPHVTPFSFGYDGAHIYGFATVGRKIAALRANPLICVAAQEVVSFQEWKSVVVSGRYEELPDTAAAPALESAGFNLGHGLGRLMAWGRRQQANGGRAAAG